MKNFWLSPNTQRDDVILAGRVLLREIVGRKDPRSLVLAREKLAHLLEVDPTQIFLFNSARSAFFLLLESLEIKKGDLVAVQAYTCAAAVDPILKSGAQPLYVDIDRSWSMDPQELEKLLEKHGRVKAVVVQHTFGVPADIERIKRICQKHELVLIEDCAHALGGRYKDTKLGKWGDFSFFSFGRDKIVSCVFGGALLVNNLKYLPLIEKRYRTLKMSSKKWTIQQLLHPILMETVVLPLYNFCSIGKIILYLLQKVGLLSKAGTVFIPAKMPESLGILLLYQLRRLEDFNNHRKKIAKVYSLLIKKKGESVSKNKVRSCIKNRYVGWQKLRKGSEPVFLRFGIQVKEAERILLDLRKKKVYLDRWLGQVVGPAGVDLQKLGYKKGSCPRAEKLVEGELQFPTGIKVGVKEARKLVKLFWQSYERIS